MRRPSLHLPPTLSRIGLPLAALVLALLIACTSSSEGGTPEATPTAAATEPTEGATTAPTEAPTAPPTLTPTPTASPTPTPTPEPTPPPVEPFEPNATAPGASYVWSGHVANAGVPWTSMRITVGADPLTDPWAFALGVIPQTRFQCLPTPTEAGVTLGACGRTFSATVNFETNEINVAFSEPTSFGARFVESTLRPVWQRDEAQASENVELLWQHTATDISGSYTDIWSADGIVFAPHFGGAIELLDATTGQRISMVTAASSVLDVKARDGILYAATTASGVLTYDVSDPAAPVFLGQYAITVGANVDLFSNAHNIYLDPRRPLVYAINDTHPQTDLRIIDVTNPAAPFEAGRFVIQQARNTLEGAHDVHVTRQGGRTIAFLNALASGFFLLDVTDPAAIEILSHTTPDTTADTTADGPASFSHSGWVTELRGRPLYLHGDEGADGRLTLYDATDLTAPQLLSTFTVAPNASVHNIEIDGPTAYVAYYAAGLRVYDLSDPESPRQIAHFDTVSPEDERDILQGAWGIHLDESPASEDGARTVYISDRETGIYALRVTLD